jgi:hypothetical protein
MKNLKKDVIDFILNSIAVFLFAFLVIIIPIVIFLSDSYLKALKKIHSRNDKKLLFKNKV